MNNNKARHRFCGKNIVITGGSSGIGLATACALARLGASLFITGRNTDKLHTAQHMISKECTHGGAVHSFCADLLNPHEIHTSIIDIGNNYGGIDIVIINAGITHCGHFTNHSLHDLSTVFSTNYIGAVHVLKHSWPYLKSAGNGHIAFVSSVAGYCGLYGYTAYAPSKFALSGLAECIRMEATDDNIGVTIIYPPDTKTPLYDFEQQHSLDECKALSGNIKPITPENVAYHLLSGILNNKFEVYCTISCRFLRIVKILFPGLFFSCLDRIVSKSRISRAKPKQYRQTS